MSIFKNRFLTILILIGFLIRLFLATFPGFQFDMGAWFAWALRINQVGIPNFYSDQIWTNYTPGYLYILGLLGFIKSVFNVSDGTFALVLKFPSIIAEVILGAFIYWQVAKKSTAWAMVAATVILFNPAFIFNSAVWGQIDGLFSLMLLLSVYFLNKKRLILSSLFLGFGFLIKPQTIALLPLFALLLIKNLNVKNLLKLSLPFLLSVFLLSYPFFLNQPFTGIIRLFSEMVRDYSYTSMFAYNFWGIVGFWISDSQLWKNLSYQTWGYILLIIYWSIILYFYFKKKLSVYALASLATLSFYFLPTRVHERYLYQALVFLIFFAALIKSRLLFLLTTFLTLIHFLNLYYVYIYYNEIFLNLPKVFHNPFLYDLLSSNSRNLSFISTLLFISISIVIIKYDDITGKN